MATIDAPRGPLEALRSHSDLLLLSFDLLGTFVFALEGAMAAIRGQLDFLGLMALAFVTAVGGGIVRDVLIGATPPVAIRNWHYGAVAFSGAIAAFFFFQWVQRIPPELLITLDAAGLSLFAVAGTEKALEYKIHPLMAVVLGGITGVGGGTIRDLLLAQVPSVLRRDVYAAAALAGATVMVLGLQAKLPRAVMMPIGGAVCFAVRMVAVARHWNLPRLMHS